jgi:hypothetical protein
LRDPYQAEPSPLTAPSLSSRWTGTTTDAIHKATAENFAAGPPSPAALTAALAQTRVRDDAAADRSARLLNAEAFAFGRQIFFRRGHYEPGSERGRALIAHELTHVAHQNQTGHALPQRLVSGDVLSVQFTQDMAKAMTDGELAQQINLLRRHLQNEPNDAGPAENLATLESEAYRRQGTAGESPPSAPPANAGPGKGAPAKQQATPPPKEASGSEEQHGKLWWALHSVGLANTKHERAELLRKGWGPPEVLFDKAGEIIDVDKLSDDEVIELDRERRGLPIGHAGIISAIPTPPIGWSGSPAAFGKEIGWPAQGKIVTSAEEVDLAKLRRAGVTEEWASEQAKIYRQIAQNNPKNPSAALRADWLEKVAARLRGGP